MRRESFDEGRARVRPQIAGTRLLAIVLTLFVALPSVRAQGSVPSEYRTKASFLATFPTFIDWPESAFPSASAPFVVCVWGDFRFGTVLADLARGASPRGRKVDVRWVRKERDLKSCHILFVSSSEASRYPKIFSVVQETSILTVGETPDFLSSGGMLNFSFENDLLQFEVNLAATNQARLRVSSRLLALARRVINKPEPFKG
jgi:YfiR/HmsC-like